MRFDIPTAMPRTAVILVLEIVDDLGARGLRACVVRVAIGDDHARTLRLAPADLARLRDALAPGAAVRGRAEHDHAVAERELRMLHDALVVGVDGLLLEAERVAEPVDRFERVVVAKARDDRRNRVFRKAAHRFLRGFRSRRLASGAGCVLYVSAAMRGRARHPR